MFRYWHQKFHRLTSQYEDILLKYRNDVYAITTKHIRVRHQTRQPYFEHLGVVGVLWKLKALNVVSSFVIHVHFSSQNMYLLAYYLIILVVFSVRSLFWYSELVIKLSTMSEDVCEKTSRKIFHYLTSTVWSDESQKLHFMLPQWVGTSPR